MRASHERRRRRAAVRTTDEEDALTRRAVFLLGPCHISALREALLCSAAVHVVQGEAVVTIRPHFWVGGRRRRSPCASGVAVAVHAARLAELAASDLRGVGCAPAIFCQRGLRKQRR